MQKNYYRLCRRMVRLSRDLLTELGVDEDNIRTEEFDGY